MSHGGVSGASRLDRGVGTSEKPWKSHFYSKSELERVVHSHASDYAVQSKATTTRRIARPAFANADPEVSPPKRNGFKVLTPFEFTQREAIKAHIAQALHSAKVR